MGISRIAELMRQHKASQPGLSSKIRFGGKIVMTAILLGVVIYGLDIQKIGESISSINPLAALAGGFAALTFVITRLLKWNRLVGINGIWVPIKPLAKAMLYSLVLGIITPGRLGEMISVAPFPAEQRKKGIVLFLLDRIGDVATVLMLSAPAAVMLLGNWGWAVGAVLLVPFIGMILLFDNKQLWQSGLALVPARLSIYAGRLMTQSLQTNKRYWFTSVLAQLMAYLMVTCFIMGAVQPASWTFVLMLPVVSLSNLISVTVGGLGVREGLAALLLPLAGVPAEVGAVSFLLAFIMSRVAPGIMGAIWFAVSPPMQK